MAEFIQYGGHNGGNYASYYNCKLSVWEHSTNIYENSSVVKYKLEIISGNSGRYSDLSANYTICIDSQGSRQEISGSGRYSQGHNQTIVLREGEIIVYHNNDGTKNIGCWASLNFQSHTYSPGNFGPSGYMDLSIIPRYAEFNGHRIDRVGLDFVDIAYNTNKTLVHAEYSLNGNTFKSLNVISGNWNQANNTVVYRLNNLVPNSNYNVETRIAHIAGLWKYSGRLNFKTKDIVKMSDITSFDFGEDLNLHFMNLENGTAKLTIKVANKEICTRENLTSSYVLSFTKEELSKMVKLLKNESTEIEFIVTTNNTYTSTKKSIIILKANIYIKKDGKWIKAKLHKKNNNWKLTKLFYKVDGTWRNTK